MSYVTDLVLLLECSNTAIKKDEENKQKYLSKINDIDSLLKKLKEYKFIQSDNDATQLIMKIDKGIDQTVKAYQEKMFDLSDN